MNNAEWTAKAKASRDKLEKFVSDWHPRSPKQASTKDTITAPVSETARHIVVEHVRKQEKPNPVERFRAALDAGNGMEVCNILNAAWFGVPETTACWSYTGFSEAVDLMEDPADDWQED